MQRVPPEIERKKEENDDKKIIRSLERELMRVLNERDKLRDDVASFERKAYLYEHKGSVSADMTRYIDRIIEERNEFEYYMTMYRGMCEDLMADRRKKKTIILMSPYIR